MRDESELYNISGSPVESVLWYLKYGAKYRKAVGRAGIPVTAASLAAELNMRKRKITPSEPDVTPSEVQEAILFLVKEGFLGLVPNRKDDTCDFRLTVPLSARERKQRSRYMQAEALRQEKVKIVSVTVPEDVTREEVQSLVDAKWPRRFKQPDLL